MKRPSLAGLFLTFLRLGATAFGGLAVIEYFRKVVGGGKNWIDDRSFNYGVAISQALPGPPTAKMATYIGLRAAGPLGATVVLVSYVLPTFVLMLLLSAFYGRAYQSRVAESIFSGLQVCILAIVVDAIFAFGKSMTRTFREIIIALIAGGLFMLKLHPILVILLSGLLGALIYDREPFRDLKMGSTQERYPLTAVILLIAVLILGMAAMFFLDRKLFPLGLSMFRIGLFSFGGGFGAIPLMFHEVVYKYQWMDTPTLLNGIALGQITPGPISITATFIGYKVAGLWGACVSTIAIFYPTLLLTVAVVPYFDRLTGSKFFNKAIGGVLCSFAGLFLSVAIQIGRQISWDTNHALLAAAAFLALRLKLDIIWVVLAGLVISIFAF